MNFVLATNPVLPERFARERLRWANIDDQQFEFVTHAQNMRSCKPHKAYFDAIKRDGCILIGDDPEKDGPAIFAGITTILIQPTWQILKPKSENNALLLGASWPFVCDLFGVKR